MAFGRVSCGRVIGEGLADAKEDKSKARRLIEAGVPRAADTRGLGIDRITLYRALVRNVTERALVRGRTVLGEPEQGRRHGAT